MPHRRNKQRSRDAGLGLVHGDIVRVAGTPISFAAEIDRVPANIDHFWITLNAAIGEPVRIALSTHSRQNAAAGFDPRMRIAVVTTTWTQLPAATLEKSAGLNYAEIEAASSPTYHEESRPMLETILAGKTSQAILIEAWGELYIRTHLGIHQVHSMRASSAVPRDLIGRDGAIRFYFPAGTSKLLLFKYSGQP